MPTHFLSCETAVPLSPCSAKWTGTFCTSCISFFVVKNLEHPSLLKHQLRGSSRTRLPFLIALVSRSFETVSARPILCDRVSGRGGSGRGSHQRKIRRCFFLAVRSAAVVVAAVQTECATGRTAMRPHISAAGRTEAPGVAAIGLRTMGTATLLIYHHE